MFFFLLLLLILYTFFAFRFLCLHWPKWQANWWKGEGVGEGGRHMLFRWVLVGVGCLLLLSYVHSCSFSAAAVFAQLSLCVLVCDSTRLCVIHHTCACVCVCVSEIFASWQDGHRQWLAFSPQLNSPHLKFKSNQLNSPDTSLRVDPLSIVQQSIFAIKFAAINHRNCCCCCCSSPHYAVRSSLCSRLFLRLSLCLSVRLSLCANGSMLWGRSNYIQLKMVCARASAHRAQSFFFSKKSFLARQAAAAASQRRRLF